MSSTNRELLEAIRNAFPQLFTRTEEDGKAVERIDLEKVRLLVGDGNYSDKYGLRWENKPEKFDADSEGKMPALKRIPDKRIASDPSKPTHVLIEGDNYHALKVLAYTHERSVDVIYVDPPYNTGNKDFKYNDRFVDKEDGYRHSKWLSYMAKRLKLAKLLLKDTGVLFISIDDNEYAQLRLLCDEVFGEANRLDRGTLIWNNAGSTKGFSHVVKNHEYILAYARNAELTINRSGEIFGETLGTVSDRVYIKRTSKNPICRVSFKKGTPIKGVEDVEFTKSVGSAASRLDIVKGRMRFENERLTEDIELEGSFSIPSQIADFYRNNPLGIPTYDNRGQEFVEIFFNRNGLPQYSKKRGSVTLNSVLADVPNSGKDALDKIIGKDSQFSYPKPPELIEKLLCHYLPRDGIALDFFAGSGTTAHAVMKLNERYGGQRQCILVTNDEGLFYSDTDELERRMKVWKKAAKARAKEWSERLSRPNLSGIALKQAVDDRLAAEFSELTRDIRLDGGICANVTYPRLKNIVEGYTLAKGNRVAGFNENLEFFQTAFQTVPKSRNQLRSFVRFSTSLLCLKAGCFTAVEEDGRWSLFAGGGKHLLVLFDEYAGEEALQRLRAVEGPVDVYVFAYDADDDTAELLQQLPNVHVQEVPKPLLDLFSRITE